MAARQNSSKRFNVFHFCSTQVIQVDVKILSILRMMILAIPMLVQVVRPSPPCVCERERGRESERERERARAVRLRAQRRESHTHARAGCESFPLRLIADLSKVSLECSCRSYFFCNKSVSPLLIRDNKYLNPLLMKGVSRSDVARIEKRMSAVLVAAVERSWNK